MNTIVRPAIGTCLPTLYHAEAELNFEAGRSSVEFEALDPEQDGFFPCRQRVTLFLRFHFDIPALALLGSRKVTVFNKTPLVYETEEPLTGFPPLNGPDLILQSAIDMYRIDRPEAPPAMTIDAPSRIAPVNRILYDVDCEPAEVNPDGSFVGRATIRLADSIGRVQTGIVFVPSRGVHVTGDTQLFTSMHAAPFDFEVRGTIDFDELPTIPGAHPPAVAIRPYSLEPNAIGFGLGEMDVLAGPWAGSGGGGPTPIGSPNEPFNLDFDRVQKIRSGETVQLNANFDSTTRGGTTPLQVTEAIWVSPHGMAIDDPHSLTPTFRAPEVSERTHMWYTLYLRQGTRISRPYKFEFDVDPAE